MAFLHELMKDYKNEIKGEWLTLWCLAHRCMSDVAMDVMADFYLLQPSQPGSISVMGVIADFAVDVMADFAMDVMADFAFSCRQPAMVYLCDGCYGRLCLLQTGSQGLSLMDIMADCHGCFADFAFSCRQPARVCL